MNVFFREAPIEENTASEYIRAVATTRTYGCKILQPYEYEANEYGFEANCELYPKNTTLCSIKDSLLLGRDLSA